MTALTLARDESAPDHQYGKMTCGSLVLDTMERPAVMVPAGTYQLALHDTPTHPRTWALVNPDLGIYHEPGDGPPGCRFACLIHSGNVATQSDGCVLVGLNRSTLDGAPDVASSVIALGRLQATLPWVPGHTLTIVSA